MEGLASIPWQRLSLEAARTWGGWLGEAGSCRLDPQLLKNFTLTGGSEGPPHGHLRVRSQLGRSGGIDRERGLLLDSLAKNRKRKRGFVGKEGSGECVFCF